MTITKQIKLNLQNPGNPAIVHAKQGDKDSRILEITLYDGVTAYEIPAGATVQIEGTKPDKTSFMYGGTIADGVVSVTLKPQVLTVAGIVPVDIVLYSGTQRLSSFRMDIIVQKKSFDDEATPSEDYIEPFSELVDELMRVKGAPLVANTAAGMTDTERIYVYTGSETGYVNGNWYYYDGSSWQVGGVYNSQGIGEAYQQEVAQMVKQSAVASESDSVPYLYRPTPNPSAILADEEIVGGTVAFNQPAKNTLPPTDRNGITFAGASDGFTVNGTTSTGTNAAGWFGIGAGFWSGKSGHKVYVANKLISGTASASTNFTVDDAAGTSSQVPLGGEKIYPISATPGRCSWYAAGGTVFTNAKMLVQVIDLTAMFGSTIADYLYTLESGTAGTGVAKLREWGFLSKPYFAYDAGSLVSVNTEGKEVVGFNLFDKSTVSAGYINDGTGNLTPNANARATDYIDVIPGVSYFIDSDQTEGAWGAWYDADKNYISGIVYYTADRTDALKTKTAPTNAHFMRLTVVYNSNGNIDTFCVSVANPATNHVRVPYRQPITYPTTPTDLNGIFKLDANNNLYSDGDRYKADGTITRKYGVVDLGTLTWQASSSTENGYYATTNAYALGNQTKMVCQKYAFGGAVNDNYYAEKTIKCFARANNTYPPEIYVQDSAYSTAAAFKTAMNGVYLCYELATPTTDTADPYPETQIVGKGGTEEWIDGRAVPVPVGHRTTYYIGVPDTPAANGTYHLTATVASGKTSMGWSS